MKRALAAMCVAVLALGGCKTNQPEYPASVVVFDPALVGMWESVKEKPDDAVWRLTLTEKAVSVKEGKIDTSLPPPELKPGMASVKIYQTRLQMETEYDLFGYLLDVKGSRLLGLQVADEQLNKVGLGFLVLPVQVVFKARVRGDEFTLWAPRDGLVGWSPGWQPLDAASGEKHETAPEEGGGMRITPSLDRLIDFYARHGAEPGFWDDEHPIVLKRVK